MKVPVVVSEAERFVGEGRHSGEDEWWMRW